MAFRWMSGLINHLYLHHLARWWQEAKPRTSPNTIFDSWIYMVAAIWISWQLFWRLSSGLVYVWYFRKTFIALAKYNHENYFRSNCLSWLHVTGLSSWWISTIQFCLVCVCKTSGWTNPPGHDFFPGNRWCNISLFECLRSCWSLCSGTRWGHPVFHSIKLVWDHLAPTSLSMVREQHSFFCLVQTSRLVWDSRGCEDVRMS